MATATILENGTTIGDSELYGYTSLATVTIPSSVTTIGDLAFSGCTSLATINYTGTEEQWNAIDKTNAIIPLTATINFNYVPPTE